MRLVLHQADDRVRVVAIRATGENFSAGADLRWMRRMADFTFEENVEDALKLADMLRTLDTLSKPTIALVQGPSLGGGVGLVAACDIVIAARERAVFALTEVRLGLVPATISPYVVAAIGARQARRYFLTAERFDADEAARIGLVHLVVPADELNAAADRVVRDLLASGAGALTQAKDLIGLVAHRPVDDDLMQETARRIAQARASEDAKLRIAAFLEHRSTAKKRG